MSNELAVQDSFIEEKNFAEELVTDRVTAFCSVNAETPYQKAALYNAISNPSDKVGDHIGETILVKDVYCETVTCTNRETGVTNICPRTVFMTIDGKSYQAVSSGIFGSVKRLIGSFGMPTWEDGLPLKIRQIKKGVNNILTMEIDLDKFSGNDTPIEVKAKEKK